MQEKRALCKTCRGPFISNSFASVKLLMDTWVIFFLFLLLFLLLLLLFPSPHLPFAELKASSLDSLDSRVSVNVVPIKLSISIGSMRKLIEELFFYFVLYEKIKTCSEGSSSLLASC